MPDEANPYLMLLYQRVVRSKEPGLAQVSFDVAVLDRYRETAGYSLIRTDTVARLKREGAWSIDVGIGADDRTIHACLQDLLQALPEEEGEHWAQHVLALPMSRNFLQMRLNPSSCTDDGEIREWT